MTVCSVNVRLVPYCSKFWGSKIFECFLRKSLMLIKMHLFDQIYSRIVKYYNLK